MILFKRLKLAQYLAINQQVPAKSAKKGAKENVKNQPNTNSSTSVKEIPFYG